MRQKLASIIFFTMTPPLLVLTCKHSSHWPVEMPRLLILASRPGCLLHFGAGCLTPTTGLAAAPTRPFLRQGSELIVLTGPFGEDGVVGRAGEGFRDYHVMSPPAAAAGASFLGPKLTLSATMSVA